MAALRSSWGVLTLLVAIRWPRCGRRRRSGAEDLLARLSQALVDVAVHLVDVDPAVAVEVRTPRQGVDHDMEPLVPLDKNTMLRYQRC